MRLALCISTVMPGQLGACLDQCMPLATSNLDLRVALNGPAAEDAWSMCGTRTRFPELVGYAQAMDSLWRDSDADLFLFMHDDVMIYEPGWDQKIIDAFVAHPIAMGGFAGAARLGSVGMYNTPFEVQKLVRSQVYSSLRSWKAHGHLAPHPLRVVMLDGLAMCIRRDMLLKINGWSWWELPHHSYDLAMSCMIARHGGETWITPVDCEHFGGQTSCRDPYQSYAKKFGGDIEVHRRGHEVVFETFRDVLPLSV